MKLRWLDRSLFVSSHYFTLCTTEKLFKKALKHLGIPKKDQPDFMLNWHSSATAHYFEHKTDQKLTVVVCLGSTEGKTLSQVNALLVHEAVHIWQQIKKAYGEYDPSSEVEAYSIQNISQALMDEYGRQVASLGQVG